MPRYVILEHDHPTLHWDLMLESGEVLRTWRLAARPRPATLVTATALLDHRRLYLDYEGPVSGNRGHVVRWDHGTFTWQKTESDYLIVKLNGVRLRGTAILKQVHAEEWSLTFAESSRTVTTQGSARTKNAPR
jgi:hypothetical protein